MTDFTPTADTVFAEWFNPGHGDGPTPLLDQRAGDLSAGRYVGNISMVIGPFADQAETDEYFAETAPMCDGEAIFHVTDDGRVIDVWRYRNAHARHAAKATTSV